MTLAEPTTDQAAPPLRPHEIAGLLVEARSILAEAQAEAATARAAYVKAALTTRSLRDKHAALEDRLRIARIDLGTLRARSMIDGTALDPKTERDLAAEVDRLQSASLGMTETMIPDALAADIRLDWTAVAAEDAARSLGEDVAALESIAAQIGSTPIDFIGAKAKEAVAAVGALFGRRRWDEQ